MPQFESGQEEIKKEKIESLPGTPASGTEGFSRFEDKMQKMRTAMESRTTRLKEETVASTQKIAESSGLSPEEISQAKDLSRLDASQEALSQKIEAVFQKFSFALKILKKELGRMSMLAVGVAALSMPNAGDMNKTYNVNPEVSQSRSYDPGERHGAMETPARSLEDGDEVIMKGALLSTDDGRTRLADPGSSPRSKERLKTHESREKFLLAIKQKVLDHISGDDYRKRLMEEFECSAENAIEIQKKRQKEIDDTKFKIVTSEELKAKLAGENKHVDNSTLKAKALAYKNYSTGERTVYVSDFVFETMELKEAEEDIFHELSHMVAAGKREVSKKAYDILSKSTKKTELFPKAEALGPLYEYLSDPDEVLARKVELDIEMEKLGIKKYGEEFTNEHYNALMRFYREDKLSEHAREFIQITDPDKFIEIFNQIAKINNASTDDEVAIG